MAYEILKEITLLYIEDDMAVMEIFSRGLVRKVKKLFTATNGQEGLEKYLEFKPDIIVTDIKMPIMSGLEMVEKIRKIDFDIPIIITSAHGETNILLEAITLNVSGYVMKPVDKKKLFTKIESNAKISLFEKEREKNNQILQNIINSNDNMQLICSETEITFTSRSFLEFIGYSSILEFNKYHKSIIDIFIKNDPFIYDGLQKSDESFYQYLLGLESKNRMVMIQNRSTQKNQVFYLKLSLLDSENYSYLLSFTEIT
jgi:YesN/AraC family two-component response regulator